MLFGETDRYYHKMRLHCNAYVYPCEWYDYNTVYTFMLGNIHFSKNLIFCWVIFLQKIHMGKTDTSFEILFSSFCLCRFIKSPYLNYISLKALCDYNMPHFHNLEWLTIKDISSWKIGCRCYPTVKVSMSELPPQGCRSNPHVG